MATGKVEVLPPVLDSNSVPPNLFDGTTRLYISYKCPYAQRTWIARNYKGLHDVIKLVPIDLDNRPAWYKEKVYSANKVPSLEHNNAIRGESLDLVKYIDANFDGPSILPDDPAKKAFAEEMLSYSDTFNSILRYAYSPGPDVANEVVGILDHLEGALSKFDDGPFFLGQFSLIPQIMSENTLSSPVVQQGLEIQVDIAYAPFFERSHPLYLETKNYDFTTGRPKLKLWLEELNKIDGYVQTRRDPQELLAALKKRLAPK